MTGAFISLSIATSILYLLVWACDKVTESEQRVYNPPPQPEWIAMEMELTEDRNG